MADDEIDAFELAFELATDSDATDTDTDEGPSDPVVQTHVKVIWTIPNFRERIKSGQPIDAPYSSKPELCYPFSLEPNVKIDGEDYIKIDMKNCWPVMNVIKMCLLTNYSEERMELRVHKKDPVFLSGKHFKQSDVLRDKNNIYIDNDGNLHLVVTVMRGVIITCESKREIKIERLQSNVNFLSQTFFNKKEFSDAVIRIEGKEIYTQKAILAHSSPVFAAMFSGDTLENKTSSVDIIDCPYDIMYLLLEYMYKGDIDKFEDLDYEKCLEILITADKYNIDSLKEDIQKIVHRKFEVNNVLECLKVASSVGAVYLEEQAKIYVHKYNVTELKSINLKKIRRS